MFLDWSTPIRNMPTILNGALVTMAITLSVFAISLIFWTFFGYLRYKKVNRLVDGILGIYIDVMRNTPLLVQIFFIFYGLPQFHIMIPSVPAGMIALSLCITAYVAEIIRGGIESVPLGQWEAGRTLNLSKFCIFWHIIFPQTMRNVFPSLINQFAQTIFSTSLLCAIDVKDLMQQTTILNSRTFRTLELYVAALLVYYCLTIASTTVLRFINRRYFPSLSRRGE